MNHCGHYRCDIDFCFKTATPIQIKEYYDKLGNSQSYPLEYYEKRQDIMNNIKLKTQPSIKDKIIYYCKCCNNICEPVVTMPEVKTNIDKFKVSFI